MTPHDLNVTEVVTETLTKEQLRMSVGAIAVLLASWDRMFIETSYGTMCDLPMEQLWAPREIPSSALTDFVQQSENRGIFRLGGSDLWISDNQGAVRFRLCHESDVHFIASDERLLQQVTSTWRRHHFTQYISKIPAAGNPHWTRIDPDPA